MIPVTGLSSVVPDIRPARLTKSWYAVLSFALFSQQEGVAIKRGASSGYCRTRLMLNVTGHKFEWSRSVLIYIQLF